MEYVNKDMEKNIESSKAYINSYTKKNPSMQNCVYKFIDANEDVLYIGKCKSLSARFNSHKNEPHLDKQCYSEVRKIQYISFPTYMDAGIMERVFISHYQPKYNVQFVKEGIQSIVSEEQLKKVEWTLLAEYPDGFPLNENKHRRMGALDKADFILYDGEGVTAEVYFYKIIKQNHKPKALKIIGALEYSFDDTYCNDLENRELLKQTEREKCNQIAEFCMRFIEESDWEKLKDYYNLKLKLPIIYKGYPDLCFGDERIPIRYIREDDYEFDIPTLVILGALEILTRNGLVDESSIRGKIIRSPEDWTNINLSKIFKDKNLVDLNTYEKTHYFWRDKKFIKIL
jgi:hypothetical protein